VYLPGLARVIAKELGANLRVLYLNAPPMIAGIRSYLAAAGIDVASATARGALVLSSDEAHLISGRFDADNMLGLLDDALTQALDSGYAGLWAAGDMTREFGPEKDYSKLREYERRLEALFQRRPELQGYVNITRIRYSRRLLPKPYTSTAPVISMTHSRA
jgi:hypothetical protein